MKTDRRAEAEIERSLLAALTPTSMVAHRLALKSADDSASRSAREYEFITSFNSMLAKEVHLLIPSEYAMRLLFAISCFVFLAQVPREADADARAPRDAPRWRLRGGVSSGFGGASAHGDDTITVFPTHLDLVGRIWGPLSLDVRGFAVQAMQSYAACGEHRRPSALGTAGGLRVDFANRRSASWVDPFLEAHAGVAGQGGAPEVGGRCPASEVFASGGARAGIDVWLGRAAVTVTVSYDYLPVAAPFAFELGASFVLY